jgi:hypothetical protein
MLQIKSDSHGFLDVPVRLSFATNEPSFSNLTANFKLSLFVADLNNNSWRLFKKFSHGDNVFRHFSDGNIAVHRQFS